MAARAGVSIGTASKALNGQGKLRAETRDRVTVAARELGFTPNVLARGLLAGRTYTVGLITTDSFGRFSIPVMLGAENALGAGQISVFMCDTRDDPARERQYVDMLLRRQVDGLIVTGRRIEPRPSIGTGLGIPVVYAMTQSLDSDEPAILPDDQGGGQLAARHFAAAGRRHLGHITGPERFLAARKRAAGFWEAAREAGLDFRPSDVLYGEWTEQWGRDAAQILLRSNPEIDAIFCGSDQLGRGVSDTLRAMGRRIPQDVALIGFDNWQPMALGAQPPLASVDMCLEDVGRIAAEHLLSAIGGEPTHGAQAVPCHLVLRESAGDAPHPGGAGNSAPGAAPAGSVPGTGAPAAATHAPVPSTGAPVTSIGATAPSPGAPVPSTSAGATAPGSISPVPDTGAPAPSAGAPVASPGSPASPPAARPAGAATPPGIQAG
ncbi:MAG TPA: substrate-binding domain-containing protein [Streptosporangiaceae bacterium]|nr:substrate-binding domain-containing protein [Streptosporangiaceae bacterium]